ncbi:MAG: PQQ-binding-like beta-propeller repeat protein [Phycisphaerae bacterium]
MTLPMGAEFMRRRQQGKTIASPATDAFSAIPRRRLRVLRLLLPLLLPALAGMLPMGPGPVIFSPPIIIKVHPGNGSNSTFREVSVNVSFSAQDQMRKARRLIRSGHLTRALMIYQHVLETLGTHLIKSHHARYISLHDYVWQKLYQSPAARNGLYDQIFGLIAAKAINAAQCRHDPDAILAACNKYMLTSAAVDALMQLSDRYFEAGHFSRALRIYRQLLPDPAAEHRRPSILFRAALAAQMAGRPRLLSQYRNQLVKQYPAAKGTVQNHTRNLAEALTQILPHLIVPNRSGSVYAGTIPPRKALAVDDRSVPNTVLWNQSFGSLKIKLPHGEPAAQVMMNSITNELSVFGLNGNPQTAAQGNRLMFSFPTLDHRVVYVDTLSRIEALSTSSGYPHWAYPGTGNQSNGQSLANLAFISMGADQISCSVAHDRVVGLLTKRVGTNSPGNSYPMNPMYAYLYHPQAYSVVCLRAHDGRLLWTRSSRSINGMVTCSPLLTRQGVFLLTAERQANGMQVRLSAVKLNPKTGSILWTHYLCTISGPAFESPSLNVQATAAGGRLYIATGAGADMAVSQRSGRICWLDYTVDPVPASNNPFGYGAPVLRIPPWKLNPPIVTHRYAIMAVSGAHHLWRIDIFRRASGHRMISFAPPSRLGLTILAGVTDKAIILTGARTAAFDRNNGKLLWTSSRSYGGPVARPVLTTGLLYLPTHHDLIAERLTDGRLIMREPWPMAQNGLRGEPGNLVVGRHGLIAVNDDSIYSYARWKTALSYLTARIRREPNRPENYLTLSQVAFAAGHISLCKKALNQALAVARKTNSGEGTFGVLFHGAMDFASESVADHHIKSSDVTFFFHAAAETARLPNQQARWRFAQARYLLHHHHPRRALTLCQQILADTAMHNVALTVNRNVLPAEAVLPAFIRLRIIKLYGDSVYQPWKLMADKLISSAAGSRKQLAEVAYGYPNSPAAPIAARTLLRLLIADHRWKEACHVALMALAGVPRFPSTCDVRVALATALLHLHHDREAQVVARATLECSQITKAQTSALQALISSVGAHALSPAPAMNFTANASFSISEPVRGRLLIPAQTGQRWRCRSGMFIVDPHSAKLKWIQPDGAISDWQLHVRNSTPHTAPGPHDAPTIKWGSDAHLALIGMHGGVAVLVSQRSVFAVNIKTGLLLWRRHLRNLLTPKSVQSEHGYSDANPPIQPFVPASPQTNFIYINGVMQAAAPSGVNMGPLLPVMARIVRFTGPIQFNFVRWTPSGLLIGVGTHLTLLDPQTGKAIWPSRLAIGSYGKLTAARKMGTSLILAFGRPYHRLIAVDASDGHIEAAVSLSAPGGYRRMLTGADRLIYLFGGRRTSAFKLTPAGLSPVWSRRVINPMPRLAVRTFLGVVELQHHGIICLNAATGTTRWHIPMLAGAMSGIPADDMDLAAFGDTVIARTPYNLSAYSADSGTIRWRAEIRTRQTPPLVRMHLADPDLALLACGPAGVLSRSEKLILIDQRDHLGRLDNGSIVLSKPLVISAADGNGPVIQSWYVLDNSIIFSLDGRIFAYHAGR